MPAHLLCPQQAEGLLWDLLKWMCSPGPSAVHHHLLSAVGLTGLGRQGPPVPRVAVCSGQKDCSAAPQLLCPACRGRLHAGDRRGEFHPLSNFLKTNTYSCCFILCFPLALTTNLSSFAKNIILSSGTSLILVAPGATTIASLLVSLISCFSPPPSTSPQSWAKLLNTPLCSPDEFLMPSLLQSPTSHLGMLQLLLTDYRARAFLLPSRTALHTH